jgi:MFS transporter, putative metabolite transport protein
LSDAQTGLIGGATLLGIMIGALVFGPLTDAFGRRVLMLADLAVFVIASLLQFAVTDVGQLVVLRVILGIAIGADYPIAGALISEYMPARLRGAAVNSMQVTWFLGATVAYLAGALLLSHADAWRWILASSAVPAAIGLALRSTAPESIRWLLMRGRREEAHALLRTHFDTEHRHGEYAVDAHATRALFTAPYLGRLAFVSAMWLLQVVPLFAMYTFAPAVLGALGIPATSATGSVLITAGFLLGALLSMWLVESWGRRPLCIAGFAVSAIVFAIVAHVSPGAIVALFMVYAVAIGAAAGLELVYPAELFPTSLRASATGFATAVSRIGAFLGTFALPLALARYGVAPVVTSCAILSLLGLAIALRYAPETRRAPFL